MPSGNSTGGGATAETQDGASSQAYHPLTNTSRCPLGDLPVEIVALIALHCHSARDLAAFAQTSKWLNNIVGPILLETICVDGDRSVIFWAAENGHTSLLRKLEDTNERFHAAGRNSGWPIARFIDWDAFGRHPGGSMQRPFQQWDYTKRLSPWQIMISAPHDDELWHFEPLPAFCVPLHLAVLNGHLDTVRFLHERGADIEAVSNRIGLSGLTGITYDEVMPGDTSEFPLIGFEIAVTPLVLATYVGNYDIARWLLQHGASAQLRTFQLNYLLGATLLHLMSKFKERKDTPRFMETLVREGYVSVDAPDCFGHTPLARVAKMGGGHSLLDTLLALGADVNYVIQTPRPGYTKSLLQNCAWELLAPERVGGLHMTGYPNIAPRLRGARRLIESGADPEIRGWQLSMMRNCQILADGRFCLVGDMVCRCDIGSHKMRPDELKALHDFMAFLEAKFPGLSADLDGFGGPIWAEGVS
ncbi:hypothetical protein PG991_013845 [Apiospora marii]|uniref:F-box domain-containing protein n=2 Tax=Apiospora marii TaxID=335849 RepID=A0ABR1R7I3_9PEZI